MELQHLGVALRVARQLSLGELAQQFVHRVTPRFRIRPQQRLPRQTGEVAQRCCGHGLGGLSGEAATKDRQGSEGGPLGRRQQIPAVLEHGSDAAMPVRHVHGGGLQEVKVLGDLRGDVRDRQHVDPGSGEEYSERHPVGETQDLSEGFEVLLAEGHARMDAPRRVEKELDSTRLRSVIGGSPCRVETFQGEDGLGGELESRSGGGDHVYVRCRLEYGGDDLGAFRHVLEVVEDQELGRGAR